MSILQVYLLIKASHTAPDKRILEYTKCMLFASATLLSPFLSVVMFVSYCSTCFCDPWGWDFVGVTRAGEGTREWTSS